MGDFLLTLYKDLAQESMQEIGKLLTAKTKNWCNQKRLNKLEQITQDIPQENQIEAQPAISIPAIQGWMLNDDESLLGEMFFNILKSSIDKTKQKILSPAFPKILEQLSRNEAVMLTLIKKYGEIRFECLYWVDKNTQEHREKLEKMHFHESRVDKSLFLMHRNHLTTFGIFKFSTFQEGEAFFEINNQFVNYTSLEGQKIITSKKISEYQTIQKIYQAITFNDFGKYFAEACISPKCEEYI